MANFPRKILYAEPENPPGSEKDFSSDCYMCYACPDHCYIPPPPPQFVSESDPKKSHVSTILIFMLCILALAFLLLSYLVMVRRNSRRRRTEIRQNSMADFLDENQGPVVDHHIWYIRTVGLPQSVIDSIGSFLYTKGDGLIECKDCSICLSEFQENETLRLLPKCSHAFHVGCIDVWLRSHKNCPVCRAPIMLVATTATTRPSLDESNFTPVNTDVNEVLTRGEVEVDETREVMPVRFDSRNKRGRVLSDIVDHRVKVNDQELRRSVSMDFSIYETKAEKGDEGCSEAEKRNSDMIVKRDCKNSSILRLIKSASLQRGPVSMKRSFSFSGKRSMRKNSRSQESVQY